MRPSGDSARRRGGVGEVGELCVLAAGRFGGLGNSGHEQHARGHDDECCDRHHLPMPCVPGTRHGREPRRRLRGLPHDAGDRRPGRASTGNGLQDLSRGLSRRPSAAEAARPPAAARPAGGRSHATRRDRTHRRTVAARPALRTAPRRRRKYRCVHRAVGHASAPAPCTRRFQ